MRLMMLAGFSFLACFLVAPFLSFEAVLIACGLLVIVFTLCFILLRNTKYHKSLYVSFFCLAAFCIYAINLYMLPVRAEKFVNKECVVSGRIAEEPNINDSRAIYAIEVDKIDGESFDGFRKIKMTVIDYGSTRYQRFDEIEAKIAIKSIRNTISFDSQYHNYSKGYFLSGTLIEHVDLEEGKANIYELITSSISSFLKEKINLYFEGDSADLMLSVIAGDKSQLSHSLKYNFQRAGYSHILNVSGMHMSIIAGFMFSLIMLITRNKRKLSSFICIFIISIYIGVTAFSVSAVRAGVMLIIYYFGIIFDKESDSLNSLGCAVFILLILNPFTALDVGFLLSTSSTLGIILCYKRVNQLINKYAETHRMPYERRKVISNIMNLFLPSVSAMIFSLPINLIFFDTVYLISPISNILASFIVTAVIVCGLMFLFAAALGIPVILPILVFASDLICKILILFSNIFSKLSFLSIPTGYAGINLAVLSIIGIVFICNFSKKIKSRLLAASIASAIALVCFIGGHFIYNYGAVEIYVVSSACKNAVVIMEDNLVYLYGTGESEVAHAVESLILSMGRKEISYLIIPESSGAEADGCNYLLQSTKINNVIYDQTDEMLKEKLLIGENINEINMSYANITTDRKLNIELFESGSIHVSVNNTNYLFLKNDNTLDINKNIKYDVIIVDSAKMVDLSKFNFNYLISRSPLDFYRHMDNSRIISPYADSILRITTKGNNDISFKEETKNGIDLRF